MMMLKQLILFCILIHNGISNNIEDVSLNLTKLHEVIESSTKFIKKKPYVLTLHDQNMLENDNYMQITTTNSNIQKSASSKPTALMQPKNLRVNISHQSNNILKVSKLNSKYKIKNTDILKKQDLFNAKNQNFGSTGYSLNYNENEIIFKENIFQLMANLYDHFYWQPSDIKNKVSPACSIELLGYLSALNNNYEWAQKAYDSSGHYRGQILFENSYWIGQKTFCLEINRKKRSRNMFEFGFYSARIFLNLSIPLNFVRVLQLGECLPKSCTTEDVVTVLELDPHSRLIAAANLSTLSPQLRVLDVRKVPGNYKIFEDKKIKMFGSFIILLTGLIFYATWLDSNVTSRKAVRLTNEGKNIADIANASKLGKAVELYEIDKDNNRSDVVSTNIHIHDGNLNKSNENTKLKNLNNRNHKTNSISTMYEKIVLCFSFSSNASAILSLDNGNEHTITCVHGIRVFSLLWTILVHTYLMIFTLGENPYKRKIAERSFFYQLVGNATFSVDSFFFLSGLLVVLIFLKKEDKKQVSTKQFFKSGILETVYMLGYRYLRLTPVYLFIIFFNEFVLKYVFNTAVFMPTVSYDTCSKFWWRNIFYINNFYPLTEICMMWSWYLANDFQFYVMAIILLIISKRYMKTAVLSLFMILLLSWGTAGTISIFHKYTHKVRLPFESFDFLYDKPWQRVGTYIIGMATGYAVIKTQTPPKISKSMNFFLWLISCLVLFTLIFGVWSGELSPLITSFYVSTGHSAWGMGLVWVTLSCSWGYSSTINTILSYKLFLPLSRLTYCTYLVHPIIMLIISFNMEGPVQLNHLLTFSVFFGNAVISFIAAFFISIAFEAPTVRLLRIFFK